MSEDNARSVQITRTGFQEFRIENVRGGVISIGEGQNSDFTPVELLLAAIGGCNGVVVDALTKRSTPEQFDITVTANKVIEENRGSYLDDIEVTFTVRFPDDVAGRKMTQRLPEALVKSHDRFCTVGRTVENDTTIAVNLAEHEQ